MTTSTGPVMPDSLGLYLRGVESRDLNLFPEQQLQQLIQEIDSPEPSLNLAHRIQTYFQAMAEMGAEPELVALVGHAITSYLQHCVEIDEPWSARFLFPPELNPKVDTLEGETEPAVDLFYADHLKRNLASAAKESVELLFKDTVLFIHGPMFSAKSGAANLMYNLIREGIGKENVYPLIFSGMGEKSIHARSLRNGDIPADQVDLHLLRSMVEGLIAEERSGSKLDRKRVVIIEEATFFEMESEEAAIEFAELVNTLRANEISVILIGLDKNYRSEELLITRTLKAHCPDLQTLECESYHLFPTPEGNSVVPAEFTGRYSTTTEMFDWYFPILVPRELAVGIDYHPLPRQYHPLQVLRECDPVLFNQLMAVERVDLLEKHTEMSQSQSES